MDKTEALRALIEAVEAGTQFRYDGMEEALSVEQFESMSGAFNGQLDAANDLHDALFHEAEWASISYSKRYAEESAVEITTSTGTWRSVSENPARAWLLAILRAYLSQQESK